RRPKPLVPPEGPVRGLMPAGPRDYRHLSRGASRREPAETALARPIFGNRALKRGTVEVRPIDRNEHKLAVSRLPKQEVRDALFAAGADQQIGIRNIRSVQTRGEKISRDRFRLEFPESNIFG